MFEREISNLKRNLSAKVDLAQRFIYLKDILEINDLHWAYKAYFNAEIDWLIYREQLSREEHLNFDFSSLDFVEIFEKFDPLLKQYARYERKDFINAINSAIKTRLNFLIRPRTALKWFIFRGEPTRSIFEIKLRLNYFADYSYLREGFLAWLEERNLNDDNDLLSILEFEKALEQIDNDSVFDLNPEQFAELLSPLFDLFSEASEEGELTIPVEALILFFDDKQVLPVVAELEKVLDNNEKFFFDKNDLIEFIYKLINQFEIPTPTEPAKKDDEPFPMPVDIGFEFKLDPRNAFGDGTLEPSGEEEYPLSEDEINSDFNLQLDTSNFFGINQNETQAIEEEIVPEPEEIIEPDIEESPINAEEISESLNEDIAALSQIESFEDILSGNLEEEVADLVEEISPIDEVPNIDDIISEEVNEEPTFEAENVEETIQDIEGFDNIQDEISGAIIDSNIEEGVDNAKLADMLSALKREEFTNEISLEETMQKEINQDNQENAMNSTQAEEMMGNLRKLLVALREIMDTEKK